MAETGAQAAQTQGSAKGVLSSLLNKDTIFQLFIWNVVGTLLSGAMQPFVQQTANIFNSLHPEQPLTPAQLADLVARGFMELAEAAKEAAKSGVPQQDFEKMVELDRSVPSPTNLIEALRRGLIPEDSGNPGVPGFRQGMQRTGLDPAWIPIMQQLSQVWPTPIDILDAYLQGQVDEENAKQYYQQTGGDLRWFDLLYNTRGSAPTPLEASEMAVRGIIPWEGQGAGVVSFEQAFLEGPWRNKWMEPYRKLAEYIPTGPEIRSMYHQGAITKDQALKWLQQRGMTPEVAQAFLAEVSSSKTQGTKDLAVSTVQALYQDRLISRDQAKQMLQNLGYDDQEAEFILEVQDAVRVQRALSTAVSKIHTLYVGHKIGRNDALGALATLQIPPDQISDLIQIWDLEATANVKTLTESQIVDAWAIGLLTQEQAQKELEQIGYLPHDAWVLLSLKNKGPLPNEPPVNQTAPTQTTPGGD